MPVPATTRARDSVGDASLIDSTEILAFGRIFLKLVSRRRWRVHASNPTPNHRSWGAGQLLRSATRQHGWNTGSLSARLRGAPLKSRHAFHPPVEMIIDALGLHALGVKGIGFVVVDDALPEEAVAATTQCECRAYAEKQ